MIILDRPIFFRMTNLVGVTFSIVAFVACTSEPRTLALTSLRSADRIDVIGLQTAAVQQIHEPARIQEALSFIDKYRGGWIEVVKGPKIPWVDLRFYRGNDYLGAFGLSKTLVVVGGLHQSVSEAEIAALAQKLELTWPPVYQ